MSINVLAQSGLLLPSVQDLPLICQSSNSTEDLTFKSEKRFGSTHYLAMQGQAAAKYDGVVRWATLNRDQHWEKMLGATGGRPGNAV